MSFMTFRMLMNGSRPFAPSDIPGLLAAWHFDDGNTLNGGDLASTTGKFGTSAALAQGTASLQPALITSWRNGHNAIQGNDTSDFLQATLAAPVNQPCTWYVVGEWASSYVGEGYIANSANAVVARERASGQPGAFSGSNASTGTASTYSTPYVGRWRFNDASSEIRVEYNGAAVNQATGLNPGSNDGTTAVYVGGYPSFAWGGLHKISMVLLYSGNPSNDSALLSYLRTWGGVTPI